MQSLPLVSELHKDCASDLQTDVHVDAQRYHEIDPKVRFATIFDMNGIILYSAHCMVSLIFFHQMNQKALDQAINAWKTRNEFANKIGKGKYVLAGHIYLSNLDAN